jgi:hypothetical protein
MAEINGILIFMVKEMVSFFYKERVVLYFVTFSQIAPTSTNGKFSHRINVIAHH